MITNGTRQFAPRRLRQFQIMAAAFTAMLASACVTPRLPTLLREPPPANTAEQEADVAALRELTALLAGAANAYEEAANIAQAPSLAQEFQWLARLRQRFADDMAKRLESLDAQAPLAPPASVFSDTPRLLREDFSAAMAAADQGEGQLAELVNTALEDPQISRGTKNTLRRNLSSIVRGADRVSEITSQYADPASRVAVDDA